LRGSVPRARARCRLAEESISYPYLWWSRADLGILERWFGVAPPHDLEETLLNLVSVKLPSPIA
jgi:hypothetical protein